MRQDRRYWTVMLLLSLSSTLYDRYVIRSKALQEKDGWTWVTVVIGVAYTLAGIALIDKRAARLAFVAFCFSGLPMSIGDIERYIKAARNGNAIMGSLLSKYGVVPHERK